ncbi:MAG TPA: hypothetical protein VFV89_09975 [Nocardioides sp.]|uniref:hypothetical protein n=1 Tax=Nocardioides sp. TaxID=35761 RepID=UPI002E373601|nr:hypothetical protein [Nocardioides sp.]HEX5088125.1 hypothetical protein [Nocardioides sp.]
MLRRAGSSCVALVAAAALLAGCSGDDKGPDVAGGSTSSTAGETGTASASDTPSLPVPAGVELSPEGSQLAVGDTATVAYQLRQGVVGVLDIKVKRLEKTSFKKSFVGWDLDQTQKNSNPYFVRVTLTNRGDTDLGGKRVPLYIVDGNNTLVESTTFASAFPPCQPGVFPKKFKPGHTMRACLVFLSPKKGELTAVSFRPTQEFDPITWTGELQKPKPQKPPTGDKGKGDKGKGDKGKGDKGGDKGDQPSGSASP